jgi:hypothetical protein
MVKYFHLSFLRPYDYFMNIIIIAPNHRVREVNPTYVFTVNFNDVWPIHKEEVFFFFYQFYSLHFYQVCLQNLRQRFTILLLFHAMAKIWLNMVLM